MDPLRVPGVLDVQRLTLPDHAVPHHAHFALDIGGSLAKLAFIVAQPENAGENEKQLCLVTFDGEQLDECLDFIRHHVLDSGQTNHTPVRATGVGCTKHRQRIANALNVSLETDALEMVYAQRGLDILWRCLPPDQLLYEESAVEGLHFHTSLVDSGVLPCLLVSVGSALIIVQVSADGQHSELVGGSTQAGLSFLGLGALLTSATDFHSLVKLAERGDRRNVDLLVSDAAGADYGVAPPDGMVSSFGKVAKNKAINPACRFAEEDVAQSLLYMITDQLTQYVYLVAKAQRMRRVVLCGSFFSNSSSIINQIKAKLTACSIYLKHPVCPLFPHYEGYLGALGVLLDTESNTSITSHNYSLTGGSMDSSGSSYTSHIAHPDSSLHTPPLSHTDTRETLTSVTETHSSSDSS